ncbi:hypothetical protein [Azospirillum rugosum]|uniref:Replication region DNA-binding N-term n=1 Tax=Azospirillum rugosum TaxID=416170 RepID=A0ABS4SVL1_9PROT|nr:hypothetical protein [Azospirillum rugosum]MBP2296604.1 hypothetical protein [Azospirillum rugosum]MDQ0530337.1 hypothetical protein [Azospirillum rugosum]
MTTPVLKDDITATVARLQKILGMLGSVHEGERDAAALAFTRTCREAGWSLADLLVIPPGEGEEAINELLTKDRKGKSYREKERIYWAAKRAINAARDAASADRRREVSHWIGLVNDWQRTFRVAEGLWQDTERQLNARVKHADAMMKAMVVRAEQAEAQRDAAIARAERLQARLEALRDLAAASWDQLEQAGS